MDLVPLQPKKKVIKAAMSNSFGFGGTNSSLIFKKYED
jgi:3-oxoacyl-[acyl-carrier-protein] synthase II